MWSIKLRDFIWDVKQDFSKMSKKKKKKKKNFYKIMSTIIIMTMIISIFLQYKLGCLSVYGGKKFLKQLISS